MSTKKRIIKNGIAAVFQKGIRIAEQLLLIPFFIQYWGAAYYGEWLTLTIVPATLALADFGFGSAAANTFLLKYAAGDKQGAADIAKTGFLVLTILILGAILLSVCIVLGLEYFGVFNKSLIDTRDAVWAVLLLLIARIVNFYQALFEAYYRAARKANISINFQSIIAIFNIIAGLVVLVTGGNVVAYALAILLVTILLNPLYIFTARRILGLYKTHPGQIDRKAIKPLIQKGFGYFFSPIWQAVYYQGMTFVVRITLGPVAVTVFNTMRTLVRSSSQAFAMAIIAIYPDFQFEMGAGNRDKAKKIFTGALALNITMAILFIVGLTLFGEPLYHWWTKNALDVPSAVWYIFIGGILFYALWFTFAFVFEALNRPYDLTIPGIITACLSVSTCWVLSGGYGMKGAAISVLLFDVIMCLILVPHSRRIIKITFSDLTGVVRQVLGRINSYFITSKLF